MVLGQKHGTNYLPYTLILNCNALCAGSYTVTFHNTAFSLGNMVLKSGIFKRMFAFGKWFNITVSKL